MTTLIVLPALCTHEQLDRVIDDLFEAMDFEQRTGFVTRVALEKFNRHGLPVYTKIPEGELTDVEWREMQAGLTLGRDTVALAEYQEIIDNE